MQKRSAPASLAAGALQHSLHLHLSLEGGDIPLL